MGPCAFWPVPTGVDRIRFGTTSAPGTLVIAGSRLVTIDRRTHVPPPAGSANACMVQSAVDLLVAGHLPVTDLACEKRSPSAE